jgi:hypothetical protein
MYKINDTHVNIAFAGEAGSGKDAACNYLVEKYGYTTRKFATPLYDILTYAQTTTSLPVGKDRDFLQYVGMWGRNKNQDIWVNAALKDIQRDSKVCISDLRFPNEFDALKSRGFIMCRIIRQIDNNTKAQIIGSGDASHISEHALLSYHDRFDYTIFNNGTLQDFYDRINKIVRHNCL